MSVSKPQNPTSLYEKRGLRDQFIPSPRLGPKDCDKISQAFITKHIFWQEVAFWGAIDDSIEDTNVTKCYNFHENREEKRNTKLH